jgi:hypothetical protein
MNSRNGLLPWKSNVAAIHPAQYMIESFSELASDVLQHDQACKNGQIHRCERSNGASQHLYEFSSDYTHLGALHDKAQGSLP